MATLLQLKSFLAVVDHGGFTAASRFLGVSQPAVSRAVASLEKELGSSLLAREHDGVVLNAAGTRVVTHAREAVRRFEQMCAEVSTAGRVAGTLRIASLPFTTELLLAPQLRTFAQQHPDVDIRVLEGSELEIHDWLDQGAAEAGVVSLPANGLCSAFLSSQEMVAVVPADHRLAASETIDYADLAKEPFIGSTGGCAKAYLSMARQVGVGFDIAFEAHGMTAVLEMVRGGLGVSILPAAAVSGPPHSVAVRQLMPKTTSNLAVAVSASAGPAARAFLAQIASLTEPEVNCSYASSMCAACD